MPKGKEEHDSQSRSKARPSSRLDASAIQPTACENEAALVPVELPLVGVAQVVLYVVPSPLTVAESPSAVYVLTELILKEEVLKLFLGARQERETSLDGKEAERRKGERTDP